MIRFLLKPLMYLLVFGLLGCTSTNWVASNPPASEERIPLIRVTLIDGEQLDLRNAVVAEESVTGIKSIGMQIKVSSDRVRSIEIGEQEFNAGKTFVAILGVPVLLWGVAALSVLSSGL